MAPTSLRVKVKVSSPQSATALPCTHPAPASQPPRLCSDTPGLLLPQGALVVPSVRRLFPRGGHNHLLQLFQPLLKCHFLTIPTPPPSWFIFLLSTFYHLCCIFQFFICHPCPTPKFHMERTSLLFPTVPQHPRLYIAQSKHPTGIC